jgi:hypothetical protein
MITFPRFRMADDDDRGPRVDRGRVDRKNLRKLGRRVARMLERTACGDGLVVMYHSDGSVTMEVELPRDPAHGSGEPFLARIAIEGLAAGTAGD